MQLDWKARVFWDGRAVSAFADMADEDAYADDAPIYDVYTHSWWLGIQVGTRARWFHGSSAKSEDGLVDDMPGVDPLWIPELAPVRVMLHIELENEAGEKTVQRLAWEGTPSEEHVDVPLTPADIELPAIMKLEVDARTAPLPDHEYQVVAVVPEHGYLCYGFRDDVWGLWYDGAFQPCPGFAPESYARAEQSTPGPNGLFAVVWTIDQRWHLHVYRFPDPKPFIRLAPDPPGNGNPPIQATFARDGSGLVVPVLTDHIGWLDFATGTLRHRWKVGQLRDGAIDVHDGKVWYVGSQKKLGFDLQTGECVSKRAHAGLGYDAFHGYDASIDRHVFVETLSYDDPLSSVTWIDGDEMKQQLIDAVVDGRVFVRGDGSFVASGRGLVHVQPGRGGTRYSEAGMVIYGGEAYADDAGIHAIGVHVD